MRGKCRRCGKAGHLARECNNPPKAWDVVTQSNGEAVSLSTSADPTPAEAAQISSGEGSSTEPLLSCSIFSGVGADLVSGGCDWGDSPAPEESDPFALSACDSDSSLGSHVSPSLTKRRNTSVNANSDQHSVNNDQSNGNNVNDSDKQGNSSKNDTDKRSSSKNDSDKCSNSSNKNDTDKHSSSSSTGTNDSDKRSSKDDSDKCIGNNSANNGSSMNDFDKSKNDSDKRNSNNVQSGTESMDTTNGTAVEHSEVADVAMSENLLG